MLRVVDVISFVVMFVKYFLVYFTIYSFMRNGLILGMLVFDMWILWPHLSDMKM